MKKFAITLMLGALMLSALAGCGKKEEVAPKNDNNTVIESESKVDASEIADSVSPTETEKIEQTGSSDSTVGIEPAGAAVEPAGCASAEDVTKHYTSQIYNGCDQTYIDIKLDVNHNLVNYDEIVMPYRAKIAEMLSADLTDYETEMKTTSEYPTKTVIKVNVNDISDDDPWLYENSVADYQATEDADPCPFLGGAIYDKCWLSIVYTILDERGISRDAIKSFECGSIGFMCEIDDAELDAIYGNCTDYIDENQESGVYYYVGTTISLVDADKKSLGYYGAVVPMVYTIQ